MMDLDSGPTLVPRSLSSQPLNLASSSGPLNLTPSSRALNLSPCISRDRQCNTTPSPSESLGSSPPMGRLSPGAQSTPPSFHKSDPNTPLFSGAAASLIPSLLAGVSSALTTPPSPSSASSMSPGLHFPGASSPAIFPGGPLGAPSMSPAIFPGTPDMSMYAMWGPSSAVAHALAMTQHTQRRPRSEKKAIPEDLKDNRYFERRKRNNSAAKKSRDARKAREDDIAIRASYLEKENAILRAQVATLREEANSLRQLLLQKKSSRP